MTDSEFAILNRKVAALSKVLGRNMEELTAKFSDRPLTIEEYREWVIDAMGVIKGTATVLRDHMGVKP